MSWMSFTESGFPSSGYVLGPMRQETNIGVHGSLSPPMKGPCSREEGVVDECLFEEASVIAITTLA
jgi:hypothetical protein